MPENPRQVAFQSRVVSPRSWVNDRVTGSSYSGRGAAEPVFGKQTTPVSGVVCSKLTGSSLTQGESVISLRDSSVEPWQAALHHQYFPCRQAS
ncbi:hypothetical protein PybrP1_005174 [[Pythium] brassicae (nom. inval.)]|nr:hypothetical protein PybrP1_005174 [[Pythium] brassicae (nom. inval.)]